MNSRMLGLIWIMRDMSQIKILAQKNHGQNNSLLTNLHDKNHKNIVSTMKIRELRCLLRMNFHI